MVENYLRIVEIECERQGLEKSFVRALILKESSGNQWATRYEPGFRYLESIAFWANRLGQSEETETVQQKTSFSYMQIMGGTARWLGFSGNLAQLYLPEVGIHYGCMLLARKLKKYGNYLDAISAYNNGNAQKIGTKFTNQAYVDDVMRLRSSLL
jgi:soluble lytic murein transglycosylase-like protein